MARLMDQKNSFQHYPYAYYATDVFFQQGKRSAGTVKDGKLFYGGKHHFCIRKNEVSALPNGLETHVRDP